MLAPPRPPSDPEALIPEARERQRRRQLVLVAAVAVAAGLGIAAYALLDGLGQKSTTEGSPRAGVPLCRSSQLSSGYGAYPMAIGDVGALILTNGGRAACVLPGTPHVTVYFHGHRQPVRQLPANDSVPNSRGERTEQILRPGQGAYLPFLWSNWCKSPGTATFRYDFGHGLVLLQRWGTPDQCAPGSPSTLRVGGPFAGV
jgi:uncharacterized protein DUF4232